MITHTMSNAKAQKQVFESLIEIIRKTSTELPGDVIRAVEKGKSAESPNSSAAYAMNIICQNIDLAKVKSQPLCQDTGTVIFYAYYPKKWDYSVVHKLIEKAVSAATKKGYLRQNSVNSLTGKNSGTNVGPGAPYVHCEAWAKDEFEFKVMLKGGGCENVGAQYSLPDGRIGAGRDLKGVRKCILDAVYQAQGKGCGPGILGVCVGGDRASGFVHSKEQFLRKLDDKNKIKELAELEEQMVKEANELGIGPMGFGGKTTLMGCKIGALDRVPASFFVSVSYMCWAYRRQGAKLDKAGKIQKWLY